MRQIIIIKNRSVTCYILYVISYRGLDIHINILSAPFMCFSRYLIQVLTQNEMFKLIHKFFIHNAMRDEESINWMDMSFEGLSVFIKLLSSEIKPILILFCQK